MWDTVNSAFSSVARGARRLCSRPSRAAASKIGRRTRRIPQPSIPDTSIQKRHSVQTSPPASKRIKQQTEDDYSLSTKESYISPETIEVHPRRPTDPDFPGYYSPPLKSVETSSPVVIDLISDDSDIEDITDTQKAVSFVEISDSETDEFEASPPPKKITDADYTRLSDNKWLNDAIINTTLDIYQRQSSQRLNTKFSNLDSLFLDSMIEKHQYPRTLKTEHVLTDRVFIPCNTGVHWFLLVIDHKDGTITAYDSLPGRHARTEGKQVRDWLEKFLRKRNRTEEANRVANYRLTNFSLPMQDNTDDCGVALLWAAEKLYQNERVPQASGHQYSYAGFRENLREILRSYVTPTQKLTEKRKRKHP